MTQETAPGGVTAALRGVRQALRAVLARVAEGPGGLAEILAAFPEALVAFESNRRILHANALAAALFGYASGDLDGRSTDTLVPERLRQPEAPPLQATGDLVQVELPGLMRDGSERAIEWCFGSVRKAGATIFVMTVRDRLQTDQTIEALRVSEERFHLLVDGVQDHAIFMLDEGGRVSSWNKGASRIKGWDTAEILGQPYEVFFTPEDRAAGLPGSMLKDALDHGSREVTGWRIRKDGSRFWAQGSLTSLRDADGRVRGFAKITRDLTERRRAEESERRLIAERAAREAAQQAEQQLRASEERLGRLQRMTAALSEAVAPEDVSNVVMRHCMDGLGATRGALHLLNSSGDALELVRQRGHSDASMADHRLIPLTARTPLADAARAKVAAFYESAEACWREYPALRESLEPSGFDASVYVPLVARGLLIGMLGVGFDRPRSFEIGDRTLVLTVGELCSQAFERARLFSAERLARESAEEANRSKDMFLAMLGHELRNPLAPIFTAMQLMKVRGDERFAHEREVIERQLSHLSRLVDDLLDVSRVARGLISISRVPLEAADMLSKAVEMASPLLQRRGQHLVTSVPNGGLLMNADPLRMAQVVSNLLTNAAKYTPPGGHVWLSAEPEGDCVTIRVRDDGDGIGPELLPHVFDLFLQGAQSVARSEGGLGLGLALVKSFVALHGGTVSATSEGPGRGSEFVVRIPSLAGVEAAASNQQQTTPAVAAKKRILVVDDNEDAREMLAEYLRMMGHEVEVAHDGPAALRRLSEFPADVAILDLGLPVMDGFELARCVAEKQASMRPRLIALTGYGQEQDIARGRAVGFDAHFVKPVDMSALMAAIDR